MHDAEERYRSVEEALLRDPEVARSEKRRGFGSSGLGPAANCSSYWPPDPAGS